jgi:hypothetical protein
MKSLFNEAYEEAMNESSSDKYKVKGNLILGYGSTTQNLAPKYSRTIPPGTVITWDSTSYDGTVWFYDEMGNRGKTYGSIRQMKNDGIIEAAVRMNESISDWNIEGIAGRVMSNMMDAIREGGLNEDDALNEIDEYMHDEFWSVRSRDNGGAADAVMAMVKEFVEEHWNDFYEGNKINNEDKE